jgi:hypothetical protein
MILSFLDGPAAHVFVVGATVFYSAILTAILLLAILFHVRKNLTASKMEKLDLVYAGLVQALREARAGDEEIRAAVRPQDFPYFEMFLSRTISSLDEMDVSVERKIAEVSGFARTLIARVKRSHGWKKALALRTLSYFRDLTYVPMLREIVEKETCREVVLAAGFGLALCGSMDSMRQVIEKVSLVSRTNEDILLVLLGTYGAMATPHACSALQRGILSERQTHVAVDFLGLCRYSPALSELTRILSEAKDVELILHAIEALQLLGDPEAGSVVAPFFKHENFRVRIRAALAVGVLSPDRYADDLQALMEDDNWWVSRSAAEALARRGEAGIRRLIGIAEAGDRGRPAQTAKFVLAEVKYNRLN